MGIRVFGVASKMCKNCFKTFIGYQLRWRAMKTSLTSVFKLNFYSVILRKLAISLFQVKTKYKIKKIEKKTASLLINVLMLEKQFP